ncbi:MFS transporter [Streptomyces sp. NPDC050560]|uniref:MFS transporter n=1 Tax=Streptomyces sp. NPDC050560 TaxID=3365630 RepID=UPI0037B15A74
MSKARHTTAAAIWALVITSAAEFMAALDNLVVTTALPSIRKDLGGALEDLEWTVSAYTLTFAVLLMLGAALGDRFGRRRLFIFGVALFSVSSAGAAMSDGVGQLVACRAVQGVGAAIMLPLSLTLLTAAVPAARRGLMLGIWSAINGLAVAAGPLIGGGLTEHISWHWIFWLNVPIGVIILPLAALRLAESKAPDPRLDVPGTLLASAGLFGIVYALVNANTDGWTDNLVLTGLIAGGALLVCFVVYEQRAERPMLPMRLFRIPAFTGINVAGLLMFLGMFGSIFLLSQFLQNIQGYTPTEAGLRMLPWTAMPMLVSPIAGYLTDKIGGRVVVATGIALQGLGLWLAAMEVGTDASYVSELPSFIVSGLGMSLYFAPAADLAMTSVRQEEQGIASGANNAMRELGGAIGIAVLSTIFSTYGSYATPDDFVDGLVPALWIGGAVVVLGALTALIAPTRRKLAAQAAAAAQGAPAGESGNAPGDRAPAGV